MITEAKLQSVEGVWHLSVKRGDGAQWQEESTGQRPIGLAIAFAERQHRLSPGRWLRREYGWHWSRD